MAESRSTGSVVVHRVSERGVAGGHIVGQHALRLGTHRLPRRLLINDITLAVTRAVQVHTRTGPSTNVLGVALASAAKHAYCTPGRSSICRDLCITPNWSDTVKQASPNTVMSYQMFSWRCRNSHRRLTLAGGTAKWQASAAAGRLPRRCERHGRSSHPSIGLVWLTVVVATPLASWSAKYAHASKVV